MTVMESLNVDSKDTSNLFRTVQISTLVLLLYCSMVHPLSSTSLHHQAPRITLRTLRLLKFHGASTKSYGSYFFNNEERIPDNWTNRVESYTGENVLQEILAQYLQYPVLFGGKTSGGTFDARSYGTIMNGKHDPTTDVKIFTCFLYQFLTGQVPTSLNSVVTPAASTLDYTSNKLGTTYGNLGCPVALT